MKVLVACEFSGVVREAFRSRGHDAWSCDILPAADGSEFHYQQDARQLLDGSLIWDLLIAHPPCTRLANSGVWVLHRKPGAWVELEEACDFFEFFKFAPVPRICIENPVPHKYAVARIGKYHQTIQPYQFGHPESKRTCLWLKNLPPLRATNILARPASGHWENQTPSGQNKLGPSAHRALLRSVTYSGIASAMAEQWGTLE